MERGMEREPREPNAEGVDPEGVDPKGVDPDDVGGAAYEALRRIEERIDRASEAAERLITEAAARASSTPPPAGWAVPGAEDETAKRGSPGDLEVLAQVLRSLRDLIPPELQQKLAEALRELLVAIRALIDWYLERVEQRRGAPAEVQDIPIL
jgi:hypothetical protein